MSDDITPQVGDAPEDTEATNETSSEVKKTIDDLSSDELKDYIRRLNRENAKHRTTNKEREAELAEFKAWKDSQKTELEKAVDRAEKAEAVVATTKMDKLRTDIASELGIDPDLSGFIKGDSEDEMRDSAKILAAKLTGRLPQTNGDVFGGRRGTAVHDTAETVNDKANKQLSRLMNLRND